MRMPGASHRKLPLSVVAVLLVAFGTFVLSARERRSELGDEEAAIISLLENSRRTADAERVRQACAALRHGSCECRQEAAHRALDRNLFAEARAVLEQDSECSARRASRGLLAEALARSGANQEVIAAAETEPQGGFAEYALAHAYDAQGDLTKAETHAKRALERGRGAPAHRLLGSIAYRVGDLDEAKRHFESMLGDNADDVEAHYQLARVARRQNHYSNARAAYLQVLALDPRHTGARYELALLTHAAGALDEAREQFRKLEAISEPGDRRVSQLRTLLGR
jgi:tetratricopeptide (TPR) repeat protein